MKADVCALQSGCTLQEAAIVASVLSKVKIPLGHSAAALMRLANMDYSGTSLPPAFNIPIHLRLCSGAQAQTRSSSAFCLTRSTRCHTRSSTPSSSTSSASQTRTRPGEPATRKSSPCSGTRACSSSANGASPLLFSLLPPPPMDALTDSPWAHTGTHRT